MTITLLILIFLGVLGLFLRDFLPPYFSQKAKNLATKEDIARITDEIESVKATYAERLTALEHQNSVVLEELKGKHQLRVAAIERRLLTHQEAFTRWRQLMAKLNDSDLGAFAFDCQQWWDQNCLFLSPAARESFIKAFLGASIFPALRQEGGNIKARQDCIESITAAGDAIVSGAALPSLGETEARRVQAPNIG